MEQLSQPLLIIGASARAAACSAMRAGFAPLAGDLFGDIDLSRACPARRVQNYPQGLVAAAAACSPAAWLYTGGLENHPDLVDEIARSPSVTEAIAHQGTGFLEQVAAKTRDRSRQADSRLQRLAEKVGRHRRSGDTASDPGGIPSSRQIPSGGLQ